MSRSGDLDQLQSRMGRIDSGTDPTMKVSATSYRGPFGRQGTDPDADFASVTTSAPLPLLSPLSPMPNGHPHAGEIHWLLFCLCRKNITEGWLGACS